MKRSSLFSEKGLVLTGLSLIILFACNKNVSAPLPFTDPVALPAKNITPTSFTADWEKTGATTYNLYVATDSNFTNPLPGYNPMSVKPDSANLTGLTSKTNYYYKVVGVDGQGKLTNPSKTIAVYTPDPSDDHYVYIGSEDMYVYCFYAGTGDKVWSYKTAGDIESSATISGGVLYIAGTDQRLYSMDALTGAKRWNFLTGGPVVSSPAVGPTAIYTASWQGGTVYGINLNGSKKWAVTPTANTRIFSSPTYYNGMVYIGSQDRNFYAFNSETGAKVWSVATGDSINSSPAISNGIVYVGSSDRNVYAYDAATGAFKWSAATGDSILSSPTISNGIVYVGSFDGSLYAFDAATGSQKWKSAITGGRIQSSPAVSNGVVYVGSFDNYMYAFDATTGSQKWKTLTGGRVMSSPTVSNGVVYAGSYDKKLYAFDAATGAIKWAAATGGSIRMSSPTVLTFPGNVVLPGVSGDMQ